MLMRSHQPATDDAARDAALLTSALLCAAALALPAALVPVRERLDNANVALVLMGLVVVAGIIAGRLPALCVAATGALSFNFFQTQPFGTLKMTNGNDVLLTSLLAICGIAVGEVAVHRTRRATESAQRRFDLNALERLTRIATDDPLAVTWARTRAEIERVLAARQVWFEPTEALTAGAALPRLDREGVHGVRVHRWTGDGFALPDEGVQIAVDSESSSGRIVVQTTSRRAVPSGASTYAVAVAGLLALAIDRRPGEAHVLLDT